MKSLPLHNPVFLEMLQGFEQAVVAQGYSGGRYGLPFRLREFLFFLETKKIEDIAQVRTADIIAYYEYLRKRPNMNREGGLSDTVIRSNLGCLRHFFKYLLNAKLIDTIPCSLPRFGFSHGAKERVPLTEAEIKMVYDAARDKTDRAILACAYGCGLRRGEAAALDLSDIVFSQNLIVVREGKNNKSRSVPMAKGVVNDLRDYIANERPGLLLYNRPTQALFLRRGGARMHDKWLNIRFKSMVKRTGNKELIAKNPSLHSLRHTIATHLVDRGATADFVRKFLGHAQLDTTMGVYAKRRKQKAKLYEVFRNHLEEHNIKVI
ncbi:MAG: tyrosine-type recombinase/integrase [Bacteroidia bacterium]